MHCRADEHLPMAIIVDGLRDICGRAPAAANAPRDDGGGYHHHDPRRDVDYQVARVLAHLRHAVDFIQCVRVHHRPVDARHRAAARPGTS